MENNSISDVDGDINYRRRLLPIATAQSSTGEYTRSIFQVVTIALLVSWVAAVLFVPYLGEKLLPDFTKTGHQAPWYVRLWARVTKNRNHKLWPFHRTTITILINLVSIYVLGKWSSFV